MSLLGVFQMFFGMVQGSRKAVLGVLFVASAWVGVSVSAFGAISANVDDSSAPICPAFALKSQNGGQPSNIVDNNNAQVLQWKTSSSNQFHERARVKGNVVRLYPDRNGHQHFSIQIGAAQTDTIEIVYNMDFGSGPKPAVGVAVEACGDYITSTAPSPAPGGQMYPASPDGAIVHWVHRAPARSGHNSGYLMIGGVMTGQNGSPDRY